MVLRCKTKFNKNLSSQLYDLKDQLKLILNNFLKSAGRG